MRARGKRTRPSTIRELYLNPRTRTRLRLRVYVYARFEAPQHFENL